MESAAVLSSLPGYKGNTQLIKRQQTVRHIIREILAAHKEFAPHYDHIAKQFDRATLKQTADAIFQFLKRNVKYDMEPEARQTIKSPAAILSHGHGDCKHYASFAGGVLDALNRAGKNINWKYRFASYSLFNAEPEHVFVVINDRGKEIWIDPTPGADKATPVWKIDKKIKAGKTMALYKISGLGEVSVNSLLVEDYFDSADYAANPALFDAIALLMQYGVITKRGEIKDKRLAELSVKLDAQTYAAILAARQLINSNSLGGLFDTIWRGVKKVTLALPRGAYLSLVAINFRGWATKLHRAVYNTDGSYTRYKDSIKKLWQDRLGGDWTKLENTIRNAYRKKAILGAIGAAPAAAAPAWVVTAGAIIAAITPLLTAILKALGKENEPIDLGDGGYIDPGAIPDVPPAQSGPLDFIKNNPLLIAGGVAAIYFFTKKRRA